MYNPLVSVVISAYNAAQYLSQTLDSVLNQTYPNIEVIVVNDGSKDNTLEIANGYLENGVKIIIQENKGQDAALNNGYHHSTGDYIKFMDSDDLINPEMIELQVKALTDDNVDYVAYGEWARFSDDKPESADFARLHYWKDASPIDFLTSEDCGPMLQCGIMLIPRNLIEKSGLWDERLILFNDTEFFTRVLLQSKGIIFSDGAKLYYRSGQSKSISAQTSRKFFESTFLATNLMAENLLKYEDSIRVRKLISNTYLMQYHRLYPYHQDLIKLHEEKINHYGCGTVQPDGGKVFKIMKAVLGWKSAKLIQSFIYKYIYYPKYNERLNRRIA